MIKRCCTEFKLQALHASDRALKQSDFSVAAALLFKQQFAGAAGRFDDCLDERDPKFPFFEFEDAVDRAASRSSNRVF